MDSGILPDILLYSKDLLLLLLLISFVIKYLKGGKVITVYLNPRDLKLKMELCPPYYYRLNI